MNVRDVTKVLICEHFLCDVLAELHDLFADVSQKGITRPTSYEHDGEYGTFAEIHCHGHAQSNQVRSNFVFCDAESVLSDCFHSISECVDEVL